ncbi:MAG TPA: cupin domain-containing protein [Thermoanaerobaculia bacterium]|nr:cupin domain-containing protein [Thermoanaerobaculia bacterium]
MTTPSTPVLLAAVTLLLVLPALLPAQEVKRTELQRGDLTGTTMEVILAIMEIPPGATVPRHFHHGEETMYVLEGAMVQMPGQASQMLAAGSSAINARDVPHAGFQVVGEKTLRLLTVHVVDKGKPLYPPAP